MNALVNKILLVDDDPELLAQVAEYLQRHGLASVTAVGAEAARALLREQHVDALVLDVGMPGESGLSFLQSFRLRAQTPVLMLSGQGRDIDRIRGLELGADDYLVKPFNPRELLARLRALLRRTSPAAGRVLSFGSFSYDFDSLELSQGGKSLPLSAGERALMKVFADHAGQVLSRERLLSLLGDEMGERFDRSIDVRVTRLRARLGEEASEARFIRTIRGQGYLFVTGNTPA